MRQHFSLYKSYVKLLLKLCEIISTDLSYISSSVLYAFKPKHVHQFTSDDKNYRTHRRDFNLSYRVVDPFDAHNLWKCLESSHKHVIIDVIITRNFQNGILCCKYYSSRNWLANLHIHISFCQSQSRRLASGDP
jgi:hypothetical protein